VARPDGEAEGFGPREFVDRVDPDALEALFRPISADRRRDRGQVTFPLAGYDVTVDANGLILIEEH